ncbi:hypothetical protein D1006_26505 [Burkholderia stabilis]|uniref:Uncharacterized protein n=1 Tax=Burkholderia stabilis TaxID=95485 RepID=A0A4Q2AGH1_9BURK|nr:hypothetical protein D1006_26505 [Burkholderia stabilis]
MRQGDGCGSRRIRGEDRDQLHEEDAYACAGVVQDYWDRPDRALVFNPGTCTGTYSESLRAIGGGV